MEAIRRFSNFEILLRFGVRKEKKVWVEILFLPCNELWYLLLLDNWVVVVWFVVGANLVFLQQTDDSAQDGDSGNEMSFSATSWRKRQLTQKLHSSKWFSAETILKLLLYCCFENEKCLFTLEFKFNKRNKNFLIFIFYEFTFFARKPWFECPSPNWDGAIYFTFVFTLPYPHSFDKKRGERRSFFSLPLSLFLLVSNRHFLNETCAPLSYAAHLHISKRERERNRWDTPTHQKAIAREKKTSFGVRFERDAAISRLENAQKLKLENVSSV